MFALEGRPFVSSSRFFAPFPGCPIDLNSTRPEHPGITALRPELLRAGSRSSSTRKNSVDGASTNVTRKSFRMHTYEKMGEGYPAIVAGSAATRPKEALQNQHLYDRGRNSRRMCTCRKIREGVGVRLKHYLRFRPGLTESRTGDAFQDSVRRRFWRDQGFRRDQQGLLQGVLPGHSGVGHAIGKHQPGGERRKFEAHFGRIALKFVIFFQVIVEAQHKTVVRRAAKSFQSQRRRPARDAAAQRAVFCREPAQPRAAGVFLRQPAEIADGLPHAGLRRMQIGKDAQDARAARGPRGKRVHVQQIVALVQGKVAPLFLEGSEAGEIELPFSGVGTEEIAQKFDHVRAVVSQDVMQMRLGAMVAGEAAQHVACGPVGDILVQPQFVPFARKQKFAFVRRKFVRQLREKENLAGFEFAAKLARAGIFIRRASGARCGAPLITGPATRELVILHRDPVCVLHYLESLRIRNMARASQFPYGARAFRFACACECADSSALLRYTAGCSLRRGLEDSS